MGKCIRFLCAALMLSMLVSLASCGYGETEKTPIDSGTSSESQTDEGTDNEVSETDEGTGTDVAAAAVEETVMWDNEDIKITAQSLTSDNSFYILHLQIENKTAEDLYMMASRCAVNGKKSRADFCNWVFPHTRNVAEMDISDKDIDGNELGTVESIQVSFKISKENMADPHPVKTQLLEIPVK